MNYCVFMQKTENICICRTAGLWSLRCMLVFFFAFISARANNGQYLVNTYTEEDWLPSSITTSIVQDRSGKIWAATRRGLVVYSGNSWSNNFKHSATSQFSRIIKLRKDKNTGNIWGVRTDDSVYVCELDGGKNKLPAFKTKTPMTGLSQHIMFDIGSTGDRSDPKIVAVFVAFREGLYVFRNRRWKLYTDMSYEITNVCVDGGNVLVSTLRGLYIIDRNGKFRRYFTKKDPFAGSQVLAAVRDKRNTDKLWVLTDNSIKYIIKDKVYNFHSGFKVEPDKNSYGISFIPNYYNSLVFGVGKGIYLYNPANGQEYKIDKSNGLISDYCDELFLDRENNLWMASFRGVSKISSMRFFNYNEANGLLDNEVTSVAERGPNDYIIGHRGGLSFFNGKMVTRTLRFDEKYNERIPYMVCDRAGNTWMACFKNGLAKMDRNDNITWIPPERFGVDMLQAVALDSTGDIIVVGQNTLWRLHDGIPKIIISDKRDYSFLRVIMVDKDNRIYVGTLSRGVLVIKHDRVERVIKANSQFLAPNNIYSIYIDPKTGVLYAGTEDGLYKERNGSLIKENFGTSLFEQFIFFMLRDKYNNTWCGTESGLVRKTGNDIATYRISDGLSGLETNRGAGIMLSNGRLVVGTNRGMSVYYREYDNIGLKIKPLLSDLRIIKGSGINTLTEKNKVSGGENSFSISFRVISFYNEKYNVVRYKLEGYDNIWQKANAYTNMEIKYRDVPAGTYRFRIIPYNALGQSGKMFVSEPIVIRQPFYLTWTFALIVLVIMAAITYYVSKQVSARQYTLKLSQEVAMRTRELEESEVKYRRMFENNNALMFILRVENYVILDVNPAMTRFFKIKAEDLLGRSLLEIPALQQLDFEKLFVENARACIDTEISFYSTTRKEQCYFLVHLSNLMFSGEDALFCIFNDISEKMAAEKAVKEANNMLEKKVKEKTAELEASLELLRNENILRSKTEESMAAMRDALAGSLEHEKEVNKFKTLFIDIVSHEYRTPLTVIGSGAEILSMMLEAKKFERMGPTISNIKKSVKDLSSLFENAMIIGNQDKLVPSRDIFDINDVLKTVVKKAAAQNPEPHEISTKFCEEVFNVYQDKLYLQEVFSQVVSNAYKFTPAGTKITISTKRDEKMLIITVRDEGPGIPEEDLPHLFEPFFRGERNIALVSGLGLGLAIAKKYIEACGGSIWVESIINEYTEVTITVPIK